MIFSGKTLVILFFAFQACISAVASAATATKAGSQTQDKRETFLKKKAQVMNGLLKKYRQAHPSASKPKYVCLSLVDIDNWPPEIVIFAAKRINQSTVQLLLANLPKIVMKPKSIGAADLNVLYPSDRLQDMRKHVHQRVMDAANSLGFFSRGRIEWVPLAKHLGVAGKLILSTASYTEWSKADLYSIQTLILDRTCDKQDNVESSLSIADSSSLHCKADSVLPSLQESSIASATDSAKKSELSCSTEQQKPDDDGANVEFPESNNNCNIGNSTAATPGSLQLPTVEALLASVNYDTLETLAEKKNHVLDVLYVMFRNACPDCNTPGICWNKVRIRGLPPMVFSTLHSHWSAPMVDSVYRSLPSISMIPRNRTTVTANANANANANATTATHLFSHLALPEAKTQMHKVVLKIAAFLGFTRPNFKRGEHICWAKLSLAVGGIVLQHPSYKYWTAVDLCELQIKIFGAYPKPREADVKNGSKIAPSSASASASAVSVLKPATGRKRSARQPPAAAPKTSASKRQKISNVESVAIAQPSALGQLEAETLDSFALFDDSEPMWEDLDLSEDLQSAML